MSVKLVSIGSHVTEELLASRATWAGGGDHRGQREGEVSVPHLLEENLRDCFARGQRSASLGKN